MSRPLRFLTVGSLALVPMVLALACGDDTQVTLPKDGGADATLSAETGPTPDAAVDAPASTCGIVIPTTYDSPQYDQNAADELALRARFDALTQPMKDIESALADAGAPPALTAAQLRALDIAGTPNLKGVTTASYQAKVDAWFDDYEAGLGAGAYTPADPPTTGGSYGKYIMNARGVDLRQAIEKGLYVAAFYNHALAAVAAGAPTEATVDKLVAAWGAHPSFQNNQNATQNKDVNSAGYAARRDSKDPLKPGPYQRGKAALIKAKASIAAGAKCNADRDAALKAFFAEWEKATYATVVFYYADIVAKLSVGSPDYPGILHSWGESLGFVAGFKGLPQDKRIITDAQIDALLAKTYGADPIQGYKLVTASIEAAGKLTSATADIKAIYGFSDAEMESFKKNF
ncbi:MAG: hypothetical protein JNL38_38270 [Myxococcales bacterium]|jgi:hypothetical protein|nr:hypothetical protein [Myxococcales bacterium]